MALSFSYSVNKRGDGKSFHTPVEHGETSEYKRTVLPSARFQRPKRSRKHHEFNAGDRVVLLSFTAGGWIYSGFRGTIVSLSSVKDSLGRSCPRAKVAWDEGVSHPAHIGVHAVSRLRPE